MYLSPSHVYLNNGREGSFEFKRTTTAVTRLMLAMLDLKRRRASSPLIALVRIGVSFPIIVFINDVDDLVLTRFLLQEPSSSTMI